MCRVAIITGLAVAACFLLVWQGVLVLEVIGGLTLGWLGYLARVLPQVMIAWDGVATAVVCLALFTLGLHRLLRWLHGGIRRAAGWTVRSWSLRWTISLVVLVVVMFMVGMAAAGIVHQAGWLIASRRSFLEQRTSLIRFRGHSFDSNLKQIGFGVLNYTSANDSMPVTKTDAQGHGLHSWQEGILPFLGINIGGEIREDLPWNAPENSAYCKGVVPQYLNPEIGVMRSPEGYGLSHYAGNLHVLGRWRSPRVGEMRAGTSNTILAGEVAGEFKPWGDPANLRDPTMGINRVAGGFGGPAGYGANMIFLDGSVRFLRPETDPKVLRLLSLPTHSPE
jgi:hypothetical protein